MACSEGDNVTKGEKDDKEKEKLKDRVTGYIRVDGKKIKIDYNIKTDILKFEKAGITGDLLEEKINLPYKHLVFFIPNKISSGKYKCKKGKLYHYKKKRKKKSKRVRYSKDFSIGFKPGSESLSPLDGYLLYYGDVRIKNFEKNKYRKKEVYINGKFKSSAISKLIESDDRLKVLLKLTIIDAKDD